jgi:hypothetical protein
MRLIEILILARKNRSMRPEVFGLGMLIETRMYSVALPNIYA